MKMFSRCCMFAVATLILVVVISSTSSIASASESDGMDYDDAVKILKQLERYYAQVARPRRGRSDAGAAERQLSETGADSPRAPSPDQWSEPALPRAVRLLQLHSLDRYYTHQSRPRFGKRSPFTHATVQRDNPDENGLEKLLGFSQTR